jgi:hypothetical protein
MTGQTVARTARYDAQGRPGVYKRTGYLVYCSVASNGHNDVIAPFGACLGKFCGMAAVLGKIHLVFETLMVKHLV